MNPYDARPWLKLYPPDVGSVLTPDYPDALTMFRANSNYNGLQTKLERRVAKGLSRVAAAFRLS